MKKRLIILISVIIIFVVGGIIYWQKKDVAVEKPVSWKIYENDKFGYSVNYPDDWAFREFPDTQTGAGFRLLNSPEEIGSECINVDEKGTAGNEYNTPFGEYIKKAAIVEIQNYVKLNSVKSITTVSGLIGYETTWIYKAFDGQEKISLPITYFENEKTSGQLKYKTVQVSLNNADCGDVYSQMLPTLKLLK